MPLFDYYYGGQAEQFSFLRVPKALIKNDIYKDLSSDAKLLYSLMLDRMSLSLKNNWVDDKNRVFIIYAKTDMEDDLNKGHTKVASVLSELVTIGLIERKKRGQGKLDLLYVKNFIIDADFSNPDYENADESYPNFNSTPAEEARPFRNPQNGSQEIRKTDFKKSAEQISRNPQNGFAEIPNTDLQKSDLRSHNNTYISNTNGFNRPNQPSPTGGGMDSYIRAVKNQIGFPALCDYYGEYSMDQLEEIVRIIAEIIYIPKDGVQIGGSLYPYENVKNQFCKLTSEHIAYVMNYLEANKTPIRNIKSYILTMLYNAVNTISSYYQNRFNVDFPYWGSAEKND